jgi:hypothetical protein
VLFADVMINAVDPALQRSEETQQLDRLIQDAEEEGEASTRPYSPSSA